MTTATIAITSEEQRFIAEEQLAAAEREIMFYAGLEPERRAGSEQAEERAQRRAMQLRSAMADWDTAREEAVRQQRAAVEAARVEAAIEAYAPVWALFDDACQRVEQHLPALAQAMADFRRLGQQLDMAEARVRGTGMDNYGAVTGERDLVNLFNQTLGFDNLPFPVSIRRPRKFVRE